MISSRSCRERCWNNISDMQDIKLACELDSWLYKKSYISVAQLHIVLKVIRWSFWNSYICVCMSAKFEAIKSTTTLGSQIIVVINTQLDNFVSQVDDIETQHMFVSAKRRWVMYETNPIENTCTNIQG